MTSKYLQTESDLTVPGRFFYKVDDKNKTNIIFLGYYVNKIKNGLSLGIISSSKEVYFFACKKVKLPDGKIDTTALSPESTTKLKEVTEWKPLNGKMSKCDDFSTKIGRLCPMKVDASAPDDPIDIELDLYAEPIGNLKKIYYVETQVAGKKRRNKKRSKRRRNTRRKRFTKRH